MSKPRPATTPSVLRAVANPILHAGMWPYPANSIFNPGAALLADGSTLLLCRVEDRAGHSHLTAARSADGISTWKIDPSPTLTGDGTPEECFGIEDPRITRLDDGRYAVCFTSYGEAGPSVSLAMTTDFATFDRLGIILPPNNKDAALFPAKVAGRYAILHRPSCPDAGGGIWIAYSDDLRHWGDHRHVMSARPAGFWDSAKIGLAGPTIQTNDGWLVVYHGVRNTAAGSIYRVGAALLDRNDPCHVVARGREWFLGPATPDERQGDVADVVFPCGATLIGNELRLYYGMADTSIGLATVSLPELLHWLRASPSE
ncbi:MAG: hypothetical protein KDA30_00630 [Phycisphaerales bacterium]|nr:hypothetical protein [Phycisphaerales bacterium]